MKKIKTAAAVLLVTALTLSLAFTCSAAYIFTDDPNFEFEVPGGYVLNESGSSDYIFKDSADKTIEITYFGNNGVCPPDNADDAKKIAGELSESIKSSYGSDSNVKVLSAVDQECSNGKTALVATLKISYKKDGANAVEYKKVFEYFGKENVYVLAYSTDSLSTINDADDSFDSVGITESEIETTVPPETETETTEPETETETETESQTAAETAAETNEEETEETSLPAAPVDPETKKRDNVLKILIAVCALVVLAAVVMTVNDKKKSKKKRKKRK